MRQSARWIAGTMGFVLLPILGLVAGVVLAFGCTPGSASIGTFLGIAFILGIIGIIAGLIGGSKVLASMFDPKVDGSVSGVAVREVDR